MSVKIKASYTNDMELREILKRLHPVGSIKMQPAKGRFKRAYIELENMGLCADMVNERAEKTENKGKNIEYYPYMCYNNYNNISKVRTVFPFQCKL